jgi:hypothetical protein
LKRGGEVGRKKKDPEPNIDQLQSTPLQKNFLVKTPIQRLDSKCGAKTNGRPRKYTPTRMRNGINKYFQWCEENDRVPSIKGMMLFLKMYKDQFYTYLDYPEFRNIMETARQVILEWCENDIYRTPGPAAGKIAYMKNVHDWSEKIDQTQTMTVTRVLSVEEAQAKIASLAPLLLEQMKGLTLKQMGTTQPVIEAESVQQEGGDGGQS